jgi:hypothetical protein
VPRSHIFGETTHGGFIGNIKYVGGKYGLLGRDRGHRFCQPLFIDVRNR